MDIIEASTVGKSVLQNNGRILIGLSIKNSYFKDANLQKILRWSSGRSVHGYVMIPDKPAVYTLMSLGYPENKARTKATLEANRLENKYRKIIADFDLKNISIIRWENIENNVNYRESLAKIKACAARTDSFNQALRETTAKVVSGNKTTLVLPEAVDIGMHFLFQELAFIANAGNILECEEIAYLYHSTMPVFKKMLEGNYEMEVSEKVGFITAV